MFCRAQSRAGSGQIRPALLSSLLILTLPVASARAQERFQASGFAWLRGSTGVDEGVLDTEDFSAQIQTGLDWYFSPRARAHLQLLARDDRDDSSDEQLGIVEAYLEGFFRPTGRTLRVRAGTFFLPTSREHVDALWETPYSITPSALNGWLGEELRPIGVDLDLTDGPVKLGATIFGGNDAFGTLPAVRGWRLRNHVALIDETIAGTPTDLSRIAVDTDDRPGWSARGRWSAGDTLLQYTYIDNRASGDERSGVIPWRTKFHILTFERLHDNWIIVAESGWGPTWIPGLEPFTLTDLRASYIMISRRFDGWRTTLRGEELVIDDESDLAVTAAILWSPLPRLRASVEATALESDIRIMAEIRTYFSVR